MSDKPRTKTSYAKPLVLAPPISSYSVLTPPKTFVPLRNPYSVLASPSQTYSQATQKQSSPSTNMTTKQIQTSPSRAPIITLNTLKQAQTSPSRTSVFTPYFSKTCSQTIKTLEKDEIGDNQVPKISRIFPSINGKIAQYHLPEGFQHPLKTQEYYEFILVDTDSAEVTHRNEQNSETIAYSKIKIKKFMTREEWGNPYQPRTFSQNFQPAQYNYFDYQQAWFKALYLKPTDHSWFLSFSPKFVKKIPSWAHEWWVYFGISKEIIPEPILSAWDYFHNHLQTASYGNKPIMFSVEFQVPWIMGWDFSVSSTLDQQFPLVLERRFRIKWWKNFQPSDKLSLSNISRWLITYDRPKQFPKTEQTSDSPSSNKTPSKKERKKKLLEEISQLGSSDEDEDMGSSQPRPANQICFQDAQDPYEDYDIM